MKPKIVILSGAGISAESGLKTFRDSGGLWEEHSIMEVATPEAWKSNPELVLKFYNERRKQMLKAEPNAAHTALVELENHFSATIITQNVDDLHERAGFKNVMHLHGELLKVRSERYPSLVYDIQKEEIFLGDTCEKGFQLRPHIVWFGEEVPMIVPAMELVAQADILIVVGTSLNVYPAAGLLYHAPYECRKFLVDHADNLTGKVYNLEQLKMPATEGIPLLVSRLIAEYPADENN